jgi:glutathione S-transferase
MASSTPVLWQIKVSHYNEKARWALDFKCVPHKRRAPLPLFGSAPAALLLTRRPTLPVLRLDGRALGDSTRIVEALEARYPTPPLYPADPAERARALELEDFFDEQLAPYVRRLVFSYVTREGSKRFLQNVLPDASPLTIALLRPGGFVTTRATRGRYGATERNRDEARAKILAAMERIEAEIGPSGYLVGDAFSIADLTAAALATPLVRPPERQHLPPLAYPEPLQSFADELAARPAGLWVLDVYRRHRGVSAELRRGAAAPQPAGAPA